MPQRFLSIKNFEKYQHYKNRNPPWIRLYYAILDDPTFIALDEVQQCRLLKLFLISSKQNNRILDDPYYLAKMLRLHGTVDVSPLIRAGFVLAERKRRASSVQAKSSLISDSSDGSDNSSQMVQAVLAPVHPPARASLFPEDFEPDERAKTLATSYGLNVFKEAAACKDHHRAKGTVFKDHQAAFRTWLRNSVKFNQRGSHGLSRV